MEGELSSYRVLRAQPEYIKLVVANLINRFGDSIDAVAFSWLMYKVTNSASMVALILGLNYVPTVLLQPLTGALVERMSKKRVMIAFDLLRGAIVTGGVLLYWAGGLTPGLLIAMTLSISTAEAFRTPAGVAIVPMLLPEDRYTVGVALNQAVSRATELIGLAVAGSTIALFGSGGALMIDALTFGLSALVIALIRLEEPIARAQTELRGVLRGFADGLKMARRHPTLPALLFVAALINFTMVPQSAFSVAYVADWLLGDANLLSATQFLVVAGMAVGSAISPKLNKFKRGGQIVAFGLMQSLSLGLFGVGAYIPDLGLRRVAALAACLLFGVASGVLNIAFSSALMRKAPKEYLARLSGISNAVMTSAIPLGSFLCSALATIVPVPTAIAAGACLSLVLFLAISDVEALKDL